MVQIRPGRYTDLPKGYLTYPIISGDKNSMGLQNTLLTERKDRRYIVQSGDKRIDEKSVTKALWEALQEMGIEVTIKYVILTMGRKTLSVFIDGKDEILPVEIRKVSNGKVGRVKELDAIRIRVTGETERHLLKNIDAIKESLSLWKIKPKECVWSQGSWKEI